jgi:eukaryotic-like serine/threonine-protein kinase
MTTLTATGQIIAGRYDLTRFIAGGAMGEVWEAYDGRMDRIVAVKVMRPEYSRDPVAVERFRTEARLAARLTHPGIVLVHDVDDGGSGDQPPWMVQEFVPGCPLSELVATSSGLEPIRAAGLIAQAAAAVHAAHRAGVVHRDLTPGNLLVCDGDVVKITDFGIARAADLPALTAAGHVLGAAAYLSPEQVRGQPASPATDIYTLGLVLYECLTGLRPFSGTNAVEVARARLHERPPELPMAVPEPLRAITAAAMATDPGHRPGSAAELATRLFAVARHSPSEQPQGHLTRPLPKVSPSVRSPAARQAPSISPPVRAPAARQAGPVATGAAAVRLAVRPPTDDPAWWPAVSRRAGEWRRRYPISRIGLTGAAVIVVVVLAVVAGGSPAAGATGGDAPGPEAGTVRVVDDVGKGDG